MELEGIEEGVEGLNLCVVFPKWKRREFEGLACDGMAFGSALLGMRKAQSVMWPCTHPVARCCHDSAKAAGRWSPAMVVLQPDLCAFEVDSSWSSDGQKVYSRNVKSYGHVQELPNIAIALELFRSRSAKRLGVHIVKDADPSQPLPSYQRIGCVPGIVRL